MKVRIFINASIYKITLYFFKTFTLSWSTSLKNVGFQKGLLIPIKRDTLWNIQVVIFGLRKDMCDEYKNENRIFSQFE